MILAIWGSDRGARERIWKQLLARSGAPPSSRSTPFAEVGAWGAARFRPHPGGFSVCELGVAAPALEATESALLARSPSIEGRPTFLRKLGADLWLLGTDLACLSALPPTLPIDPLGLAGQVAFLGASHRLPRSGLLRIPSGETWTFSSNDTSKATAVAAPGGVAPVVVREPPPRIALSTASVQELTEAFWSHTKRAVRRATDGFGHVAVMAAGGLDSSAMLAAAVAEARGANAKEVSAIAWHFGGRGDDRPYFAELTKDLGIHPVYLAPSVAAKEVLATMVADGLPLTPLTVTLQTCALRAAKAQGADVLLLGSGGDEVLAGVVESGITGDDLGSPLGLVRALGRAFRYKVPVEMPVRRRLGLVFRPMLRDLVPRTLRHRRMRAVLTRWMPHLGPLSLKLLDEVVGARTRDVAPRDPVARYQAFAGRGHFEEYAEHRSQIESFSGLPIRDPYLDAELASFVASIPPPLLLHGDFHRGLFRAALRGKVPEKIRLRRDKASFEELVAALMNAVGVRDRARQLSRAAHAGPLGIVDAKILTREVAAALDGNIDEGYFKMSFLWSALVVEAFLEVA